MKIFAVDAETDGLYGRTIAIGAVCGADVFHARIPMDNPSARASESGYSSWRPNSHIKNDWVRDNVIPVIWRISTEYPSSEALEEEFWQFYRQHANGATVIAHCAAPVEASLFRRCIEPVLFERAFQGPLPLHDLGTLLLALGEDPASDDAYMAKHGLTPPPGRAHDPLYDARVTEIIWVHAMGRLT